MLHTYHDLQPAQPFGVPQNHKTNPLDHADSRENNERGDVVHDDAYPSLVWLCFLVLCLCRAILEEV